MQNTWLYLYKFQDQGKLILNQCVPSYKNSYLLGR